VNLKCRFDIFPDNWQVLELGWVLELVWVQGLEKEWELVLVQG
jgi:hypothetical protein